MTLVVTALTPQFVVQLSDMRLTDLATQAVRNEEQSKAIVLSTADARVVTGWCGCATDTHNRHNTGDWLMDVLPRLASRQPALNFPEFINQFAAAATTKFRSITEPLNQKACSIVMAGWIAPRSDIVVPITVRVSNCEDEGGKRTPARDTFDPAWMIPRMPPPDKPNREPNIVTIFGAEEAISKELGRALLLLLRRDPTPEEVMNVCLRLMREASAHPIHGRLIGRNWVGVEMRLDSPQALAHYFPGQDSPQQFMPNLVTPQQAFKDVKIWTGPGDPPWRKK